MKAGTVTVCGKDHVLSGQNWILRMIT